MCLIQRQRFHSRTSLAKSFSPCHLRILVLVSPNCIGRLNVTYSSRVPNEKLEQRTHSCSHTTVQVTSGHKEIVNRLAYNLINGTQNYNVPCKNCYYIKRKTFAIYRVLGSLGIPANNTFHILSPCCVFYMCTPL